MADQEIETNDEFDGLSDEEIAALQDDEGLADEELDTDVDDVADDDTATLEGEQAEPDADADLEGEPDAAEQEDKPADEADAEVEIETDEQPDTDASGDDTKAEEETAGAVEQSQIPQYQFDTPEGAQERLTSIEGDINDLGKKLEEGEIDLEDYHPKINALNNERTDLRVALSQADMARQMNEQAQQQSWDSAQNAFFDANPDFKTSQVKYGALDAAIRSVTSTEEAQGKPYSWVLAEGKKQVDKEFGVAEPEPAAEEEEPPAKPPASKPKPEIPPTLGGLPAAAENDVGKGQFTHLDGMDGLELEAALASMPQAQADAYLEGK